MASCAREREGGQSRVRDVLKDVLDGALKDVLDDVLKDVLDDVLEDVFDGVPSGASESGLRFVLVVWWV